MELFYCWPYEELKVTKLEETPRAFRFETPWYATEIVTSEAGEEVFENVFLNDTPKSRIARRAPGLIPADFIFDDS